MSSRIFDPQAPCVTAIYKCIENTLAYECFTRHFIIPRISVNPWRCQSQTLFLFNQYSRFVSTAGSIATASIGILRGLTQSRGNTNRIIILRKMKFALFTGVDDFFFFETPSIFTFRTLNARGMNWYSSIFELSSSLLYFIFWICVFILRVF